MYYRFFDILSILSYIIILSFVAVRDVQVIETFLHESSISQVMK
jgi:hypothetical protein